MPLRLPLLAHCRRRWLRAAVLTAAVALGVAIGFLLASPATVQVGAVDARISAGPGSGSVVRVNDGRPVTDDLLSGPLQVRVALAMHRTPGVTERQILAALAAARGQVVRAGVQYLLRVAAIAVLVGLLVVAVLLGLGPVRAVVTLGLAVCLVAGSAGATVLRSRLTAFDATTCAHGWSRYVLSDLRDLTPAAPAVKPPAAATAAGNPDLVPVLLISDAHLNPEGLDFALRLQQKVGARAVLDAGDTTSFGVSGESCVVAPAIRAFRVPYVWVRGNHDSQAFARSMRETGGVTVLDRSDTTVAGLDVYGVADPSFTPRTGGVTTAMAAADATTRGRVLTDLAGRSDPPDVVLVHECGMADSTDPAAPGVDGIVPLVVCGHIHREAEAHHDGTLVLHTGTVGAGGLDASAAGRAPFAALVLFFDPGTHRLVKFYDVEGFGPQPATFTLHTEQPPPPAPPPSPGGHLARL